MSLFFEVSGIGKEYHINVFNFLQKWPSLLSVDALIMLGVFFFSYAFKMINEFILTKEYRTISLMKLMFQPYARIFIQQVVVILGSMFLSFGAGAVFIVIFALVKTYVEIFINYEGLLDKAMKDMERESGKK